MTVFFAKSKRRALVLCGLLCLLICSLAIAGCGKDEEAAKQHGVQITAEDIGFPIVATKNTTRVGGRDSIENAAATSLAVYPGKGEETRTKSVALVDVDSWRVAISASQLFADPIKAPILFSSKGVLPQATESTLKRLNPTGSDVLPNSTQVISIGAASNVPNFRTERVQAKGAPINLPGGKNHKKPDLKDQLDTAAATAYEIDLLHTKATHKPSDAVIIAPAERPEYAMPAAAWSAKSGDPVLWIGEDRIPEPTIRAIKARKDPKIYLLGPADATPLPIIKKLRRLGNVQRVGATDVAANSVAFSRYRDGAFGWGVIDPGHGLVFASAERPQDAAAAAPLSASGTYGPLLVLDNSNKLENVVMNYLLDIQPGYESNPGRGNYNHAWLIGDQHTLSQELQSHIDALLEIQRVKPDPNS